MIANSDKKPSALFEIEENGEESSILFYPEFPNIKEIVGEEGSVMYEYDFYRLDRVRTRPYLRESVESMYQEWLDMAMAKEQEPAPETDKERIAKLEAKNAEIEAKNSELEQLIDAMLGVSE